MKSPPFRMSCIPSLTTSASKEGIDLGKDGSGYSNLATMVARIRKTDSDPPRFSVLDVISAVTLAKNPHEMWRNAKKGLDKRVSSDFSKFKFSGQGANPTPVANHRGIQTIISRLVGKRAVHFRWLCAEMHYEHPATILEEYWVPPSEEPKGQELVYIATSPLVDVVKIGKWSGNLARLRGRYRTYYGKDLELVTFETTDSTRLEGAAHREFAPFNMHLELFRKGATDYAEGIKTL